MTPEQLLVALVGRDPYHSSYGIQEPASQVLPYRKTSGVERQTALSVRERLRELRRNLVTGLAVEGPALAPLRGVHDILSTPTAAFASGDAALPVAALPIPKQIRDRLSAPLKFSFAHGGKVGRGVPNLPKTPRVLLGHAFSSILRGCACGTRRPGESP